MLLLFYPTQIIFKNTCKKKWPTSSFRMNHVKYHTKETWAVKLTHHELGSKISIRRFLIAIDYT